MSIWSFNFAMPGRGETSPPRRAPEGYPLDLDGSERYIRPATGWTLWPDCATYPNGDGIGMVSGILRQFDAAVYAQMIARVAAGPLVTTVPADPMRYIYQAVYPQMPQVGSGEFGVNS